VEVAADSRDLPPPRHQLEAHLEELHVRVELTWMFEGCREQLAARGEIGRGLSALILERARELLRPTLGRSFGAGQELLASRCEHRRRLASTVDVAIASGTRQGTCRRRVPPRCKLSLERSSLRVNGKLRAFKLRPLIRLSRGLARSEYRVDESDDVTGESLDLRRGLVDSEDVRVLRREDEERRARVELGAPVAVRARDGYLMLESPCLLDGRCRALRGDCQRFPPPKVAGDSRPSSSRT
jgi:hypothetical protein